MVLMRLALVFLMCVAVGCTNDPGDRFAEVGSQQLSISDVDLRVKEQRLENSGSGVSRELAARQLLSAMLGAEVLAKHAGPHATRITSEVLESEAARIDQATLMPDKLREIKALFPTRSSFLNLYVLPVYVNRELYYGLFLRNREFHREAIGRLEAFSAKYERRTAGNKGLTFGAIASASGLTFSQAKVTAGGFIPLNGKKETAPTVASYAPGSDIPMNVQAAAFGRGSEDQDAKRLIDEVLSTLPDGQLTPVLEWPSHFSVMRILKRQGGTYWVEIAAVEKTGFPEWFQKEARSIPVRCFEKKLCPAALSMIYGT